ncbi:MAG: right-handed parallel beta-helix repeat-containing protein [Candidatus Heimdallarchaeota archaeon]|nr:right-handed parallel beta-helix repeat-containing protein [Candidatus Heimdallarchaeota archaeon]MCK4878841.1 right-handed parallel beta-helix repeat-containing protein [Candidatus Heimdallarchaeota archaeon]
MQNKNKLIIASVLLLLCLSSTNVISSNAYCYWERRYIVAILTLKTDPGNYRNSSVKLNSYIPHDPINIKNDANFTDYGFPGTGNKESPYRIENLYISSSSIGISITTTSQYFVINNCFIQTDSEFSIFIENIKNETAIIKNNFVERQSYSFQRQGNVFVKNSAGCQILNNTSGYDEQVKLENSSFCKIKLNRFSSFIAYKSPNCTIEENIGGVLIEDSNYCLVAKNNIPENFIGSKGIQILNSSYCFLSENLIYNRSSREIKTPSVQIPVTYYYEGYGIFIDHSSNCSIVDNSIINNGYGIAAFGLNFSTFIGNIFSGNSRGGIVFHHNSFNNLIYHNRFMENGNASRYIYSRIESQAVDNGVLNYWYSSEFKEGNYWSEHKERLKYEIDGRAIAFDPYPLREDLERLYDIMFPFKGFRRLLIGLGFFVCISPFVIIKRKKIRKILLGY